MTIGFLRFSQEFRLGGLDKTNLGTVSTAGRAGLRIFLIAVDKNVPGFEKVIYRRRTSLGLHLIEF